MPLGPKPTPVPANRPIPEAAGVYCQDRVLYLRGFGERFRTDASVVDLPGYHHVILACTDPATGMPLQTLDPLGTGLTYEVIRMAYVPAGSVTKIDFKAEGPHGYSLVCQSSVPVETWPSGGPQFVLGGDGNDTIRGGPADDVIGGGKGNDAIDPGAGQNLMLLGQGVDTVLAGIKDTVLDAVPGQDVVLSGELADAFRKLVLVKPVKK